MDQEMKQAYEMFSDFWRLYKLVYTEQGEVFWEKATEMSSKICKKYRTAYCKDILLRTIMEFESMKKNVQEGEKI